MSADAILIANEQFHDDEASHYDETQPYIRNGFAQAMFLDDIQAIADVLGRVGHPLRVLDCGAGTGNLTMKFLARGAEVTAVDISAKMLERLHAKAGRAGAGTLRTVHSDIDSFLETAQERYDVICSSSFLHHLPDYQATYARMTRVASDEAIIYTAFEPRSHQTLTAAARAVGRADGAAHEFVERRLYNPWVVIRAVLRRMRILPTPRNILNEIDNALIERPALGIDTVALDAVLQRGGFQPAAICWRAIARHWLTYVINRRLLDVRSALFLIAQRSASGRQPLLHVHGDRFCLPS